MWKKRNYIGFYIVAFLFVMIVSYYVAALFSFPDISLINMNEKMSEILAHPFRVWYNDYTFSIMGLGFVLYLLLVVDFAFKHRNFHFGKEHGTAQFADIKQMQKELPAKDPNKNRRLTQNIEVSKERDRLSNNNMLIIGASGSYKTTSMLTPNILKATSAYVVLDVKGDLLYNYGNYFLKKGYAVRTLNLKKPLKSDRYNPFRYVNSEQDIIKLITNLQSSVKKPDAMSGEPFWDDGARLYLQAIFMYEWLDAKESGRMATMNNILKLVNYEAQKIDENTTKLSFMMDVLAERKGDHYPPVRDYRKLKDGASETVRSIILIINAMLSLCETSEVKRIFEDDDMNIEEIGTGVDGNPNKRVILFLVLPDNDTSYNFLISMFYTQMFDVLMNTADEIYHGPLPVEVEVWMDEFYAGAKPSNPDALLGVVRSRNINMIPILQSISQIKTLFKDAKWETMMDNVATVVYLGGGPMASSTHESISKALGDTTIDSRSEGLRSGKNGDMSNNYQGMKRAMMTPDEVKRIPRTDCVVFLESRDPIYDKKAIPFDTEVFKYANSLEKYIHPVEVIYNEKEMAYGTIMEREQIQFLEESDVAFYKEAAKTDQRIKIFEVEEEAMLYLNWSTPAKTEQEVEAMFQSIRGKDLSAVELPADVEQTSRNKIVVMNDVDAPENAEWDLSGTIFECIARHHDSLNQEQKQEILFGLEQGLTDQQIKSYFMKDAETMNQMRRAYELLTSSNISS